MTCYVTVFNLQDGVNEELVGPFDDAKQAMDWMDSDSLMRTAEDPKFSRQSSEELVMVGDFSSEEPSGYVYQILEPVIPATVVTPEES